MFHGTTAHYYLSTLITLYNKIHLTNLIIYWHDNSVPCQYETTCRANHKDILYTQSWEGPWWEEILGRFQQHQTTLTTWRTEQNSPRHFSISYVLFFYNASSNICRCWTFWTSFALWFLDNDSESTTEQRFDKKKTSTDTTVEWTRQQLDVRCCFAQISLNKLTFVTLVMSHTVTTKYIKGHKTNRAE